MRVVSDLLIYDTLYACGGKSCASLPVDYFHLFGAGAHFGLLAQLVEHHERLLDISA